MPYIPVTIVSGMKIVVNAVKIRMISLARPATEE